MAMSSSVAIGKHGQKRSHDPVSHGRPHVSPRFSSKRKRSVTEESLVTMDVTTPRTLLENVMEGHDTVQPITRKQQKIERIHEDRSGVQRSPGRAANKSFASGDTSSDNVSLSRKSPRSATRSHNVSLRKRATMRNFFQSDYAEAGPTPRTMVVKMLAAADEETPAMGTRLRQLNRTVSEGDNGSFQLDKSTDPTKGHAVDDDSFFSDFPPPLEVSGRFRSTRQGRRSGRTTVISEAFTDDLRKQLQEDEFDVMNSTKKPESTRSATDFFKDISMIESDKGSVRSRHRARNPPREMIHSRLEVVEESAVSVHKPHEDVGKHRGRHQSGEQADPGEDQLGQEEAESQAVADQSRQDTGQSADDAEEQEMVTHSEPEQAQPEDYPDQIEEENEEPHDTGQSEEEVGPQEDPTHSAEPEEDLQDDMVQSDHDEEVTDAHETGQADSNSTSIFGTAKSSVSVPTPRRLTQLKMTDLVHSPARRLDALEHLERESMSTSFRDMVHLNPQQSPERAAKKRIPSGTRTRKEKATKAQAPSLPASLTRSIFKHFSQRTVSKAVMEEVEEIAAQFWKDVSSDLAAYAHHADRSTVIEKDVEMLLRRQGFINEKNSLNSLIENYLSMEYRQELIPIARSGNVVERK